MFKNNIKNNIKNIDFKKINIKKIVLSCFLALVLVVQITFLKFLFSGITPDDKKTDENVIMSYNSNGKFDYKVYLKPNEFINKEYLDEGEAYILDLIDHININSFYNFSSTEKTSVSGNNKITAKLVVNYRDSSESNGNPELLSKEKVLDEKVITFDNVSYSTSGNYDLYLDEYLKVLRDFQSKVKISVEGYVEILSETKFNGKIGGASYNDSYSNTLKVPLSSSVIKISNSKGKEKTSKVYEGDLVKTNKKVMSFIVLGNYSLGKQISGQMDFIAAYEKTGDLYTMIIGVIRSLPCAPFVLALVLITMIAFYATSFDSIALTASCYSYHRLGEDETPNRLIQLMWCILLILLPIALVFSESSMSNLQSVSIIAAFPIGAVIVLIVLSFMKDAKKFMEENEKQRKK